LGVIVPVVLLWVGSAPAGVPEKIAPKVEAFPLGQVKLLDGPWKVGQAANRRYLMSLEPDGLLYAFRKNAGLDAPGKPLGGWEAPDGEVRGHSRRAR
jgi:hypothetical protein